MLKKIKYLLYALLLLLQYIPCNAINNPNQIGARGWAMGGASVANIDAFSAFNNQAAMAFLPKLTLGFYADNRFGIADLGAQAFALALPTRSATLALSYQHFGMPNYSDQKIGIAVAKQFGEKIAFGIQLDYFANTLITQKSRAVSFEAAMLAKLTEKTQLGIQIYNPIQTQNAEPTNNFQRPTTFRVGVAHQLNKKVCLAAEAEKDLQYAAPNAKVGIEYQPVPMLYIRGGISTNPQLNSLGIGFKFKGFVVDVATSLHPVLRASSHASLIYQF
jgi:hypothetical protein